MKPEELIELLKDNKETDTKYFSWRKLDPTDVSRFTSLGNLSVSHPQSSEYPTQENYWSENYPFALNHYPNSGCAVFTDGEKGYYLIYRDFGGHAPERRCRLLRKDLVIC